MENTELGQFLHIEMWTKMWSNPSMEKLNKTKSSGEIFKTTVYSRPESQIVAGTTGMPEEPS